MLFLCLHEINQNKLHIFMKREACEECILDANGMARDTETLPGKHIKPSLFQSFFQNRERFAFVILSTGI